MKSTDPRFVGEQLPSYVGMKLKKNKPMKFQDPGTLNQPGGVFTCG